MMDCAEAQELRSLSLDGELDPTDAPRLREHLAHCPVCGPAYAAEQALSALVKREARRFRAPVSLRERISSEVARRERRWRFGELRLLGVGWNPVAIAASIMLAIVGTSYLEGSGGEEDVAQAVVASHIRSLMANHLTDIVSSDQHTVKPWFNGKIDFSPPVNDYAEQGFPLIGGRLDYVDHRNVAALVYRRNRHLINVYVWPEPEKESDVDPESVTAEGYHMIFWEQGGMYFCAVSDLNARELQQFAELLQK
jgi:anti-sigma factor (TIGR02949 family)